MRLLLLGTTLLSGCSFIFNPDHINRDIDAASVVVDTEMVADVDPTMLRLTSAWPAEIFEGVGTGNARAQLVVLYGQQIAADATVTITPANAVKLLTTTVADDHNFVALTVEADDDGIDNDGMEATPLTVSISQSNGMYTSALDASALKLTHLNSLKAAPTLPLKTRYSTVAITGDVVFPATKNAPPIKLTSVGSISVAGKITADASGLTPGPGGCAGGAVDTDGDTTINGMDLCTGHGYTVPNSGLLSTSKGGGGAGFVVKGGNGANLGGDGGAIYGTAQLESLSANTPSGGAGGPQNTGSGGGIGGGAGGEIVITAGGDLTVTSAISANGANGANVGNGGGGGGGDGGVIIVRSGGTTTLNGLSVTKGLGGQPSGAPLTNGVAGGDGSMGRTRADTTNALTAGTAVYTGPMFVSPPTVALTQTIVLMVRGPLGDMQMSGQAYDRDDNPVAGGEFHLSFSGSGVAMPSVLLKAGYNKVCVSVPMGNPFTLPESSNCTEIAFLPGHQP